MSAKHPLFFFFFWNSPFPVNYMMKYLDLPVSFSHGVFSSTLKTENRNSFIKYWYSFILSKLENIASYNSILCGLTNEWFKSDLSNRKQYISIRDCRQITFVTLNRFCPLNKTSPLTHPFSQRTIIKMDIIPTKIKCKILAPFILTKFYYKTAS